MLNLSNNHSDHSYPILQLDYERISSPMMITLWVLLVSAAKTLFHLRPQFSKRIPESCVLIVLGIIVGFSLQNTPISFRLDTDSFFLFLLPPIVFEAGYFLPARSFLENLGTILLYAVIGTIWNTFAVGTGVWFFSDLFSIGSTGGLGKIGVLQALTLGSITSAVDPVSILAVFEEIHVNEVLHTIVLGESLLNDAVTVAVFHGMESMAHIGASNIDFTHFLAGTTSFFLVFLGGTLTGVIWGYLAAYVTRWTEHVHVLEPLFVFVLSYLAYLSAELMHLSGIMACVVAAFCMRQYVEENISYKSHTTIKYFSKMCSAVCEAIIFLSLGFSAAHMFLREEVLDFNLIMTVVFLCLISRFIGVYILTWFANKWRLEHLDRHQQFIMAYGGIRGAVAYALVTLLPRGSTFPHLNSFEAATIVVIFFTMFVQGATIKPLVKRLHIKTTTENKLSMFQMLSERMLDHIMAGVEDITGRRGSNYARDQYEHLNNNWLRPFFLRNKPTTSEPELIRVFTKLNVRDAMEFLAKNHSNFNSASSANNTRMDPTRIPNSDGVIVDMQSMNGSVGTRDHLLAESFNALNNSFYLRPRRILTTNHKHMIAEDDGIHHHLHYALRHLVSHHYQQKTSISHRKSVTFSNPSPAKELPKSSSGSEDDVGISFTANVESDIDERTSVCAERTFPWKDTRPEVQLSQHVDVPPGEERSWEEWDKEVPTPSPPRKSHLYNLKNDSESFQVSDSARPRHKRHHRKRKRNETPIDAIHSEDLSIV